MTIGTYIKEFNGLEIEAFDKEKGVQDVAKAIRLEVDYEAAEDGVEMLGVLASLKQDPKASEVSSIILGAWEEAYEVEAQQFIDFFIDNKNTFSSLNALFIGEMTYEDNEISWIIQGNYSGLLDAYPQLECLRIRGGTGLSIGQVNHSSLKELIIETGGLNGGVLDEIAKSELPSLTRLELWLGDDGYGGNAKISNVEPLLSASKFANLKHLAIKNSEIQDDVTIAICNSDLINQLEVLDVSMGIMSDKGGEALLSNKDSLEGVKINASENYLSEDMCTKLTKSGLDIDVGKQKEVEDDDDDYRYVSVSE
jgi:hypothetical protein